MRKSFLSEYENIRLHILAEVSQQITSILDIDELLVRVVRLIQQTFNYYHVGIGLIEGDEVVYRVGAGVLWDDPMFQFKPARLKVGSEGITGWVAKTGEPALIPDVAHDPRYVWMQGSQTHSEITVPISVKNQVIGVLDVQSDQLNDFDESDVELISSMANQTGVAIENARLFSMEQRRTEQFRVLTNVSQQITSILDIDDLLKQLVNLVQRTFGYYHIEIGMIEGDDIVFRVGAGELWEQPGFAPNPSRLKVGQGGIAGWVAATGKVFVSSDICMEPRYVHVVGSRTQSELTVPILAKGQVIGVLDVESDRVNAFDETDVELISSLANQLGVAIENARLYENAKEAAVFEERQRLARELHDSVTQSLYGIELYSQAALGNLSAGKLEQVDKNLKDIHETSQEVLAEMRLLIYELRPPVLEKEGLIAVLQARLSAVEGRAGLKIKFKSELTERVSIAIEEGLCHIAQEALNNILKHAHAQNVSVSVGLKEGKIILTIIDDGIGFDLETNSHGGLGLASMKEHAEAMGGKLSLFSQPNHGTEVKVEVEL